MSYKVCELAYKTGYAELLAISIVISYTVECVKRRDLHGAKCPQTSSYVSQYMCKSNHNYERLLILLILIAVFRGGEIGGAGGASAPPLWKQGG